jgi:hypothetical protein
MLSRIPFFLAVSILASFVLTSAAFSQSISSEIYETEEDLLEGLEKGYLTLDQYLELLDLLQSKLRLSSSEADKLYLIPGVSSVDLLEAKAQDQEVVLRQNIDSFLADKDEVGWHPVSGRLVWKLHQDFEESGETENYLLCEMTGGEKVTWRMEADHLSSSSEAISGNGTFRVRKRFLRFELPRHSAELVLGNFDRRIGLGLNVGYHPLLHHSGESDPDYNDTFLYPVFGRYNGFSAVARFKSFRSLILYSKNKGTEIEDRTGALDLSYLGEQLQMGLCISNGELKSISGGDSYSDECSSFHLDLKHESLNFSSEYALLSNKNSGLAFDLYSSRKLYSFDLSWWRYDDDFIHPHGGGISNPDYETIHLEGIDYDLRARQAGERGVFFKSGYKPIDRLSFSFSYSQWRERSYLPDKMKLRIGAGYRFSSRFYFKVYQLWTDYDVENEEVDRKTSSLSLSVSPRRKLTFNLTANYRSTDTKDYGDFRLKVSTRLISPFDLAVWLKYYDSNFAQSSDAYLSFHVQEKVRLSPNYFVSGEYVLKQYQDETKTDNSSARVRIELLW